MDGWMDGEPKSQTDIVYRPGVSILQGDNKVNLVWAISLAFPTRFETRHSDWDAALAEKYLETGK